MNIRDIKMKARSVLANQKNIFYVFIFISIITTLVDYAGASFSAAMIPFASLIISVIMLPFSHGNIVASLMVLAAPIIPSQDVFWSFFALNVVMLLVSYVVVFPAFLKLRKICY